MIDKRQVMFDIERCICYEPGACRDCSKYKGVVGLRCIEELMADAYDLLKEQEEDIQDLRRENHNILTQFHEWAKEQEAVEPYSMDAERTYGICPKCGKIVFRYGNVEENHYCGVCGKKVKWDE